MKRLMTRGLASIGAGRDRGVPPPRLVAIADGLLITEHAAEAWFLIPTRNSDLSTEAARDAELDRVVRFATTFLADRRCHLKIVWGRVSGAAYAAEVAELLTPGAREWATLRGAQIDASNLPQRYVLLGVHLANRDPRDIAHMRGAVADALGLGAGKVSQRELAHLSGLCRKLGQGFATSAWTARLASVEEITWMISREMHRDALAVPRQGTVTGASLNRLTSGKVVPYSDHLRIYDVRDRVAAYTAVLTMDEFDEVMDTPGPGEWLRTLAEVGYVDDDGIERAVNVEASVRFRVLPPREASKVVDEARRSANEQSRSASRSSALEAADEITETEAVMREVKRDIKRDGQTLVEDHPRLLVTAGSRAELDVHVDAVIQHFADLGVSVNIGANEQRDLWLETLPGDRLRVPDLGHVRESPAFFGSSFWCGSAGGDATGPAVGTLTGSTPGIVRNNVAAGSALGDATTTVMVGRSGRGKTTAIMLSCLDATAMGAWSVIFDLKGDLAGIVTVAKEYGMTSGATRITSTHSGAADPFRILPLDQAVLQVPGQLMLICPREYRGSAEALITQATRDEARAATDTDQPTTWGVIQRLREHPLSEQARQIGEALEALTETGLGSIVAGPPRPGRGLSTDPGLWLISMPGLNLPEAASDPDQWTPIERVSMAALRGVLMWMVSITGSPAFRQRAKVVCIPEVHLLAKTNDGRAFLNNLARMGRAFGTSLVLDTQDSTTITENAGLVEQVTTAFVFSQRSGPQLAGAAELLGMTDGTSLRQLIRDINTNPDRSIRHGHCLMRDRRDEVATVQFEYPSAWVAEQLNTNPDGVGQVLYDDEEEDVA